MIRNFSSSATQPIFLRRRHRARQERGFECGSRWVGASSDFDECPVNLDLSVHHSSSPLNNRFQCLASPPPAHVRDRDNQSSGIRRRPRNSRGTREAKKRRDARRNERKHAAQLLDKQLSKDIDEILANANLSPPTQASQPMPTPIWPTTSLSRPLLDFSSLSPGPPTPPKLPPLNFSHWSVDDFLPLRWQHPYFAKSPFQLSPIVPNWCPTIPSLISNRTWSGKVPSFTDLSHLSERKPTPEAEDQQALRPWTTDLVVRPRKQSKFFPTSRPLQSIVKLPPTACKLHHSEQAMQNPFTTAWNLPSRPAQHDVDTLEHAEIVMQARDQSSNTDQSDLPSAANLWHILIDEKLETLRPQVRGCESCWQTESDEDGGVALPATGAEQTQPFELAGKEILYVHTNSLTGHGNDTARYHSDLSGNGDMTDSAIHLAETIMPQEGAALDYELAAMPWPLAPRAPSPDASRVKAPQTQIVDNAVNVQANTDADDLTRSTDHFDSEQTLFETQPVLANSNEESTCDLATFLKMGHVENCWCSECYEEPELVNEEPQSSIHLTEEDGWMTWSSTEDETGSISTASPSKPDQLTEDEKETVRYPCARAPEWDEMFPSVPKQPRVESVVETEPEEDAEFLGYYDDGPAFARENDYDWLWNL